MAIVRVPLSSAFGCHLTPSSTSSRFSSKSVGFRVHRISCDYSCFEIKDVSYRLPGTKIDLLNTISFSLPEKSFGMIFGQSGSGKTTLLQLIAGLSKPTSGSIYVQRYGNDGHPNHSPEMLHPGRVGIVFQFPERYFVADNILDEIVFAWPRQRGGLQSRELLASRLEKVLTSVGLTGISLDKDPHSLSGGYKRRLALAIQLVQTPYLLVLDEPLAGLGSSRMIIMSSLPKLFDGSGSSRMIIMSSLKRVSLSVPFTRIYHFICMRRLASICDQKALSYLLSSHISKIPKTRYIG